MKNVILFLALLATGVAQEPKTGQMGPVYTTIGPIHREIAETSPVAKILIEQIARDPRIMSAHKIAIRVRTYNTTDHEINFQRMDGAFDVRNIKTGKRAPETPTGCTVDFFSECYTSHMPMSEANGYGRKPGLTIKPNEFSESTDLLDAYYELSPGEYSVVSYFCAEVREGPECFKSNTITITIPPATNERWMNFGANLNPRSGFMLQCLAGDGTQGVSFDPRPPLCVFKGLRGSNVKAVIYRVECEIAR